MINDYFGYLNYNPTKRVVGNGSVFLFLFLYIKGYVLKVFSHSIGRYR